MFPGNWITGLRLMGTQDGKRKDSLKVGNSGQFPLSSGVVVSGTARSNANAVCFSGLQRDRHVRHGR